MLLTESKKAHLFPLSKDCLRKRFYWADNTVLIPLLMWSTWTEDNGCHNEAMVCSSWHFFMFLAANLASFILFWKQITPQSPHFICWDYCQEFDRIHLPHMHNFMCLFSFIYKEESQIFQLNMFASSIWEIHCVQGNVLGVSSQKTELFASHAFTNTAQSSYLSKQQWFLTLFCPHHAATGQIIWLDQWHKPL